MLLYLEQGLLLLVAHMYENREPVITGASASIVPETIEAIFYQYRLGDEFASYDPAIYAVTTVL